MAPIIMGPTDRITPGELRKMPRSERQAILAAAELAEPDYRDDKELTGFEAFTEEEGCFARHENSH